MGNTLIHPPLKKNAQSAIPLLAILITIAAYGLFFRYLGSPFYRDWYYFNSLALVIRSSVLQYQTFPGHNPWICGGVDILTNPQNRIFSPFLISDILLDPQVANLFVLLVYTFIGIWSFYRLLIAFGHSEYVALTGATMFVCGSWFGLHFSEGHVTYGSMQLLPLIMLCGIRLEKLFYRTLLLLVMGLMILDGGIYSFIFSMLLLLNMIMIKMAPFSVFLGHPKRLLKLWGLIGMAFLFLVLPKMVPVLVGVSDKKPVLDFFQMPWQLTLTALFFPFQTLLIPMDTFYPAGYPFAYGFHEFGCYLSLLGVGLIVAASLKDRGFIKSNLSLILSIFFWFWVGSGFLDPFNPWFLFQKIPFFNIAHVQSRLFIIMFLFFILLLTRSIEALKLGPKIKISILIFLMGESLLVRNFPMTIPPPVYESPPLRELIQSTTITNTKDLGWTPQHYLTSPNTGSARCYEPSFFPTSIRDSGNPNYRGEAYFLAQSGRRVKLLSYTPGKIKLSYDAGSQDTIELNTNSLYGWRVLSDQTDIIGKGTERLQVVPRNDAGEIELEYVFPNRNFLIISFFIGLVIFGAVYVHSGTK
jgi:hypothetical protein